MNILIVDDDRMICAGTARRITDLRLPEIESVVCAFSGEEALQTLCKHRFDAMFTDIRMGSTDGLQLIAAARELYPDLICIVITAFDHFQYAQQAIRLGVDDYVLKPLSRQSMARHVRAVIDKHNRMNARRSDQLELELNNQLLSGEHSVAECFALCGVAPPPGEVCMAVWKALPEGAQADMPDDLWTWHSRSGSFLLAEWRGEETRAALRRAAVRMETHLGVSLPGSSPKTLGEQARDALKDSWPDEHPCAVFWQPRSALSLSRLRADLFSDLHAGNSGNVCASLQDFLSDLSGSRRPAATTLVENVLAELAETESSLGMPPCNADVLYPGAGASRVIEAIADRIERIRHAASENLNPVAYAQRYAREHLYESIDMAVIANRLNLSYAYFSRIFREQAGVPFSKYLLDLRMQEICRLLLQGEKLVTISDKFGYQNAANLTRSFTREMGMSPSKWLEKHSESSPRR